MYYLLPLFPIKHIERKMEGRSLWMCKIAGKEETAGGSFFR
jgi:hypothetical protein